MTAIKPLFVVTHDSGGAGIAALRLVDALKTQDVNGTMLTYYKRSRREDVTGVLDTTSGFERWWLRGVMRYNSTSSEIYRTTHHNAMWSNNDLPHGLHKILNQCDASLLQLHWVGMGFMPITSFAYLKKPIVWTLHDMWAFTGGCHITQGCTRYETHCGNCPQLASDTEQDLSYRNFERKLKHWHDVPMTIITPSHWLAHCTQHSTLLGSKSIEVIPNPIDTVQFQPLSKAFARQALHLPSDKQLILFGAGEIADGNKGLDLLIPALTQLAPNTNIELVIFGGGQIQDSSLPMRCHPFGLISDTRLMALLYSAADVVVVPSRQENLNNTVMEALACGTPCVTFNIGGMPDMLDHQQNGYLAEPYSVEDLAHGIQWVLSEADTAALSHNAREKVLTHFSMEVVARQYISVYERILGNTL